MNRKKKTNIGHSVFQRLLNIARSQGADFNLLLYRYGMERFLYRLSISAHSKKFILKGASMFLVWKGQNFRVTKDADLLYAEAAESGDIIHIFKECSPSRAFGVPAVYCGSRKTGSHGAPEYGQQPDERFL